MILKYVGSESIFSPKKAPAGKCTHGKIVFDIFLQKRPLQEDAHTAKGF